MKEGGKRLTTKWSFQPAAPLLHPAWHVSGAQDGVHASNGCLLAHKVLPFHNQCSDEAAKKSEEPPPDKEM